jgi:hypothetical protein
MGFISYNLCELSSPFVVSLKLQYCQMCSYLPPFMKLAKVGVLVTGSVFCLRSRIIVKNFLISLGMSVNFRLFAEIYISALSVIPSLFLRVT